MKSEGKEGEGRGKKGLKFFPREHLQVMVREGNLRREQREGRQERRREGRKAREREGKGEG